MPVTDSPLRYPGGKTKIYNKVQRIINQNMEVDGRIYIEPYAGGAGLALKLLYNGDVEKLVLNDYDYHIYCFWDMCLEHTDLLCSMIESCDITIEEWKKQKKIYDNVERHSQNEVGFATFFLNRCNVSGIIKGGPIGGMEQKGTYKLDARFNKTNLIKKIRKVASYKDVIKFYNMDAIIFLDEIIDKIESNNIFLNIDPPYVKKGPMLYDNSYTETDHILIADKVRSIHKKWIVTYDECELIKNLYSEFRIDKMQLNYSAGNTKKGQEYIVYSNLLEVENENDRKSTNT